MIFDSLRIRSAVLAACLAAACLAVPSARAQEPVPAPADSLTPAAPAAAVETDSVASEAALPAVDAPAAPSAASGMNARMSVKARRVQLTGSRNVVRSGPGDGFAIAGVYPEHAEFTVIAKSGDWYGVKLSDTETGWVHRTLCKEMDDLSGLEFKPNPKLFTRTGTFILSGYSGGYAFDRKSNSFVLGGKLGYYVFDRLQVEGGASWTHVHRPAEIVESLFGLSLEAEEFHMLFYHLNANVEILPGRQMVPYISAGVGSSIMRGESEPSINYGAGTTLYLSRRTAVRWEVRDYRFDIGSENNREKNDNIEFSIGSLVLF